MIETLFGLGREGHLNAKGMPSPVQLALIGRVFSDVIVLSEPLAHDAGAAGVTQNGPKEREAPPGRLCIKRDRAAQGMDGAIPGWLPACEFAWCLSHP
jgi:hypothetical protein